MPVGGIVVYNVFPSSHSLIKLDACWKLYQREVHSVLIENWFKFSYKSKIYQHNVVEYSILVYILNTLTIGHVLAVESV